jgi:hypothetical protein
MALWTSALLLMALASARIVPLPTRVSSSAAMGPERLGVVYTPKTHACVLSPTRVPRRHTWPFSRLDTFTLHGVQASLVRAVRPSISGRRV